MRNALEDTDGEIRKLLTGRLPPAYHTYVRDLTPAQCAYVLSVYHCEVIIIVEIIVMIVIIIIENDHSFYHQ